jgi:hypothetical protein
MGVFDFMKGYKMTKGSVIDKIKGGLSRAINKFLELPILAIGWIADKVLGWFGVDIEGGVGKKIKESVTGMIGSFVDGVMLIVKAVKSVFSFLTEPITEFVNRIKAFKDEGGGSR